ncbi:PIN domain-containing protein [Lysobacter korlensis]|uniref:PIN domain-containing protein n=1 Tax=Lysobacter korlensis TaxID=553636 RepID=A0ABV6RS60_9GAMM
MAKPYYLIDFENVQPKALDRLRPGEARIKVFLGQQQTKLMLDLVQALQPFGSDAEYISITGSGPDAVDFHIAYYIGRLAVEEPGATFRIISKDKGFDPLVCHLTARGIGCQRLAELPQPGASPAVSKPPPASADSTAKKAAKKKASKAVVITVEPAVAPKPATAPKVSTASRVKVVLECLAKSTRPTKVSGLRASIKSWFKPALDDKQVDAVLQSLQSSKRIAVEGAKVTYALG